MYHAKESCILNAKQGEEGEESAISFASLVDVSPTAANLFDSSTVYSDRAHATNEKLVLFDVAEGDYQVEFPDEAKSFAVGY